jgi:hypothetical protein
MSFVLTRPPQNDNELYWAVYAFWGVKIPRTPVCPNHSTPFQAFADAYFARSPMSIWKASRGMGGKSRTLAYLTLTEAVLLGAEVNILGGSGAQSINIHEAMRDGWNSPTAPSQMLINESMYETRLTNNAKVRALLASQRSVRGPHPQRLRLDEIDEMDVSILDSAMGQPMSKDGVDSQVVMSSTHQYPDKTMSEMLLRAAQNGWPVYEWCWRESSNKTDGWLTQGHIDRTRQMVTKQMWEVEYDLQEPAFGSRAFDTEMVEKTFEGYGDTPDHPGRQVYKHHDVNRGEQYEFEAPDLKRGEYVTGADWAKEKDWTVIVTYRVDCDPWRLVAFSRTRRKPYPLMIKLFNKRLERFGGAAIHDATGLGNVVNDYLDKRATPFIMSGRQRDDMLTEFVSAVESGKIAMPKVESAYTEMKYCHAKGSPVRTFRGLVPIEEVEVGDLVMTRAGWRPVSRTTCNGIKDTVRLRFSNGSELVLTPDHSIAGLDGWVEAQTLQIGDVVHVTHAGSALSTPAIDPEILSLVGMPVGAMGDSGSLGGDGVAPMDVLLMSDRLQVLGVDATAVAAEMIKFMAHRDGADQCLVSNTMSETARSVLDTHAGVAQTVDVALPDPASVDLVAAIQEVLTVDDYSLAHLVSSQPSGLREVYDLTVEGEHEYVVDGVVTHNCSLEDLYGRGKDSHLPDTVCAFALAWHKRNKRNKKARPMMDLTYEGGSPWREVG